MNAPNPLSSSSKPFVAADHHDRKHHLLLAASGSVATIKLPNIVQALSSHHSEHLSIILVLTEPATRFLAGQSAEQPDVDSLAQIPSVVAIFRDEDEWRHPWTRGAGILHIELRRWADLMVVAPLSADSLAKIVAGFSDSLLLSVVRAWNTTGDLDHQWEQGQRQEEDSTKEEGNGKMKKRIMVAPAMNTAMWRHPVTKEHIQILEHDWGVDGPEDGWFEVLRPVEKELACGDVGDGAMMDWRDVVKVVEARLGLTRHAS